MVLSLRFYFFLFIFIPFCSLPWNASAKKFSGPLPFEQLTYLIVQVETRYSLKQPRMKRASRPPGKYT